MRCSDIEEIFGRWIRCEETDLGFRVNTHCLYPSFEQVAVYVRRFGDKFVVSDGGGAVQCVLRHGKGESSLKGAFEATRKIFALDQKGAALEATAVSQEWLFATILSVSNGSAKLAAFAIQAEEETDHFILAEDIGLRLQQAVTPPLLSKSYKVPGASGKSWRVDFAILTRKPLFIKTVTPHHVSVNSNYAAFSDISERMDSSNLSVFDRAIAADDIRLLSQVTELVPLEKLESGVAKHLTKFGAHE